MREISSVIKSPRSIVSLWKLMDLRFIWLLAVGLFSGLSVQVCLQLWHCYRGKSVVIELEDTHYPLYKLSFPAVTVCAGLPVIPRQALRYMSRYLNLSKDDELDLAWEVINTLSNVQYPKYARLMEFVKPDPSRYYPLLNEFNTTDFMLKVLPKIDDILDKCYWHGHEENCSQIFSLQRTEAGFCYSFNSLTSESSKSCSIADILRNEGVDSTDVPGPKDGGKKCVARRINNSGGLTGLLLTLKDNSVISHKEAEGTRLSLYEESTAVTVVISAGYELPEVGSGVRLWPQLDSALRIELSPQLYYNKGSLEGGLSSLEDRQCLNYDEKTLTIFKYYSMPSCLIQSRNDLIKRACKCRTFHFNDSDHPECKIHQLYCVGNLTREILSGRGVPLEGGCPPLCRSVSYDFLVKRNYDTIQNSQPSFGSIDVYYSNLGAVRYKRYLHFDNLQLLDSFGGVVNLFLGSSFISTFELIYYGFKLIFERRISKKKIFPQPTRIFVH